MFKRLVFVLVIVVSGVLVGTPRPAHHVAGGIFPPVEHTAVR